MANQQNDRIYLDGELYELLSTPLKVFFEARPDIPAFRGKIPECRRGYMASWRIRNNVLYLTGFQQVSPTVVINPRDVLTGPKMVADWYDGTLRIPIDSDKSGVDGGDNSHETELHITVQGGVVYNHEIVQKKHVPSNNSKKNNVL
ncbi:hypothetical protein [Draconibacterium sediminis]|uniref:Uncharacterized protein n=1 Tax=Draconibacterium sediminis TaxID=1544798 RepID=A0A0D8J4X8_9BACT|nr:hypothetical protein [Draconibacterium sediminis]KJF41962.1 hypothetical protein LH29_21990 [Draconibacterium sediminis]